MPSHAGDKPLPGFNSNVVVPRRPSNAAVGVCFFDNSGDQSWHSNYTSQCARSSFEELRSSNATSHEIDGLRRSSCVSEFSVVDVDHDIGVSADAKVDLPKVERDCRICHLGLESAAPESGLAFELGCSCKDDLAAAHRQCAETWFKIKGNKVCEICGSTAQNVIGAAETECVEHLNETNNNTVAPTAPSTEARSFWQGHRFLNFLLACMVFAFVISWLFHFNVPG